MNTAILPAVTILGTGLIYRNPAPHVRSIHAYFPSVVAMENGEMLATFALGEAFEAADSRSYFSRSTNWGETWELEGKLPEASRTIWDSNYCRLTSLPGGN